MDVNTDGPTGRGAWFRSPTNLALLGFLGIAGFFLIAEHRAHVFGVLPYALLLACPLLHVFMHRGHGGQSNHSGQGEHAGHTNRTPNESLDDQRAPAESPVPTARTDGDSR